MRKSRILIVFVMVISLLGTLFTGCGNKVQDNAGAKLVTVRLNEVMRSMFYTPMYVAINEGFFKEEGLEIDLTIGNGADKTMQQVLSNNADIGFCGSEQVIYSYTQGREDYPVLFAQLTKRDGSFIVARAADPNFTWEKLKGKTILGGRPGGMPEMTLEYVLRNHGLTISYNDEKPAKDVNIITNVAFANAVPAFKGGIGEYGALFEPGPTVLQTEGSAFIVASIGKESGELPYTCYFTTKSYMEKNPQIVQKFTNALYKGVKWVESHTPEESAKSIKKFFDGVDESQLAAVIKRFKDQDTWTKDLILTEESMTRIENIIQSYKADLLPQRPPYDRIVNNKFAVEAGKNLKK